MLIGCYHSFVNWRVNIIMGGSFNRNPMVTHDIIRRVIFFPRVVIYKTSCLDVAQDGMNGVSNETRTHLWRLACLASLLTITQNFSDFCTHSLYRIHCLSNVSAVSVYSLLLPLHHSKEKKNVLPPKKETTTDNKQKMVPIV